MSDSCWIEHDVSVVSAMKHDLTHALSLAVERRPLTSCLPTLSPTSSGLCCCLYLAPAEPEVCRLIPCFSSSLCLFTVFLCDVLCSACVAKLLLITSQDVSKSVPFYSGSGDVIHLYYLMLSHWCCICCRKYNAHDILTRNWYQKTGTGIWYQFQDFW